LLTFDYRWQRGSREGSRERDGGVSRIAPEEVSSRVRICLQHRVNITDCSIAYGGWERRKEESKMTLGDWG
jgi:hypothetical protein